VPLPTLICVAFATGVMAAIASRTELRLSPRHAMLTNGFGAYVIFASLVLVPVSVYFYVFHGDWFLLYLFDVQRIPSAIALLGFVLEAGIGALGFGAGAALMRSQRDTIAGVMAVVAVLIGIGVPLAMRERLAVVASFAQFEGGFGLTPFTEASLLPGAIAMSLILTTGLVLMLVRLVMSSGRG
jgi:hypothetical protein